VEIADRAMATEPRRAGEPRAVVAFCLALLAAALGIGVGLLAAGARLPAPGPILLLALVAALCVNRFALFPTEHASTAEAAVLLAAVVAFRDDAVFLGPLVVALLVGPLDALHWEQRSFLRMAHNAGNRGLATLAASAAFVAVSDTLGTSAVDWCIVIAVAGSVFVLVDLALSTTLLRLQGEPATHAFRHLLEVDALTLPIAWYGALVALVLGGVGWWAIALALVPAAFVPELVIARAHRDTSVVRDLAGLLATVAVLGAVALVTPVPGAAVLVVLVGIGLLAGIELVVDRRTILPPLVAVGEIGAFLTVDRDHVAFAAALVATVAVVVSWWIGARDSRPRLFAVLTTALGASLLAAELGGATPRTLTGLTLGALVVGFVCEAVAVATSGDRRRTAAATLWTVPIVAAAIAWALVWRSIGTAGAAVFGIATTATLAGAVWWGTPAWRSRVLQRTMATRSARRLFLLALAGAGAAILSAVLATAQPDHAVAVGWAWVSVGLGESITAMAAVGVRQWRFDSRPRALGLATLLGASVLMLVAVPVFLIHGSVGGPALLALALGCVAIVARAPAGRAGASSRAHGEVVRR
jgi:hypothetical protein